MGLPDITKSLNSFFFLPPARVNEFCLLKELLLLDAPPPIMVVSFLTANDTGTTPMTTLGSDNERRFIGDCVLILNFFGSSFIVSSRVLRFGITFLPLSSVSE